MDSAQAIRVIGRLRAFYPRGDFPPETADAYASVLVKLPLEDVAAACGRLVERTPFLPAVSEIVQEVRVVQRERRAAQLEEERRAYELSEPDVTPEEAAENVRRARELVMGVARAQLETTTGGEA